MSIYTSQVTPKLLNLHVTKGTNYRILWSNNYTLQELQNFVPISKDVGHLFHVNIH